ncbi:unnamed protein product [Cunninghamella blakesleeana]
METDLLLPSTSPLNNQKPTYRQEFYWLIKNAIPLVISYLLQNSLQSVSVITAGRLGPNELAATALASLFITVTGFSTVMGTTLCLDTLCSQAYTNIQCDKKLVGLHVQRCLIFLSFLMIPIALLWWSSESIFIHYLHQDPYVSQLAGQFIRWMILSLPAFALFETLKKMLQAQGIFRAPTYCLFIGAPLNMVSSYFLVYHTPLQFLGAPMAAILTYWLLVLLLILYILFIDGSKVWPTLKWMPTSSIHGDEDTLGAILDYRAYGPMLKLAIPGILLICSENWAYEIIALAANWIKEETTDPTIPTMLSSLSSLSSSSSSNINQSAQSVLVTSVSILYTIPFGLGIAGANRVGNLLGAQRPQHAFLAAKAILFTACMIALSNGTLLFLFKNQWGYLFTDDSQVIEKVSHILPIVAIFVIADNIAGVADGILNGMGLQKIGSWFNLVAYYLTSLPIGFYLCFVKHWGLLGIWTALMASLVTVACCTVAVVWCTDWKKEAQKALNRGKSDSKE